MSKLITHWICVECGTNYYGSEEPTPIEWSDNHKCKLMGVNEWKV